MYKKKFNTIDELFASEEFKKKDLSYCDLEGLDLSGIDYSTWRDFVFDHTNFTDTNIRFYPELLKKCFHEKLKKFSELVRISQVDLNTYRSWKMEYCNFTNCDLSYLEKYALSYTSVKGSNFTDTNLDAIFTPYYGGFNENILGAKDYSDVIFPNHENILENIYDIQDLISWEMIKSNPLIPFSPEFLLTVFRKNFSSVDEIYFSANNRKKFNMYIDELLEEDLKREGKIVHFYNILNRDNPFSEIERILFFLGRVTNKEYKEIDLSSVSLFLLNQVCFKKCKFEKIIFPRESERRTVFMEHFKECLMEHVCFPTITYHSWEDFSNNRIRQSRITFYRNLYLELGRFCNGKCKFCRNQYLEFCPYDFAEIRKKLIEFGKYFNNIFVGGGEPTSLLDDLKELRDCYNSFSANWTVFTNASLSLEELISLNLYFNLNISRHSINDTVNNEILGVTSLDTESLRKLSAENKNQLKGLTLCPTCFKGDGIDTVEKVEDYIDFAYDLQIDNLLFQTLHRDLSMDFEDVLPIDDEIFDEVIAKLREQNYEIVPTIYSTGDYKLIIARNGIKQVSFKKYITEEELKREWPFALKRTFDFSMDPSGNLYENFHQTSGKVIVKK